MVACCKCAELCEYSCVFMRRDVIAQASEVEITRVHSHSGNPQFKKAHILLWTLDDVYE